MISEMDTEGKGHVSVEEWVTNLNRCAGLLAAIEANINADGVIEGFEPAAAPAAEAAEGGGSEAPA